jgi:hypothetical protein
MNQTKAPSGAFVVSAVAVLAKLVERARHNSACLIWLNT